MIATTNYELSTLFISVILGFAAVIVYGIMRSLHPERPPCVLWDILTWAAVGSCSFLAWTKYLHGVFRWYIPAGYFCGAIICFFTLEPWLVRIMSFCVKKIYSFFNIILKILLTAARFLGKILIYLQNDYKIKKIKKIKKG